MSILLKANRLRVEFDKVIALASVSFELSGGDLLGLIGPNGSGKTTLLRSLVGLQAPTSGSVQIMGHDVFSKAHLVRGYVGFAPDDPPAYGELRVDQFLYLVADIYGVRGGEADERLDFWLEQLWLTGKRNERIGTLSRGMKQRVTIAQTLLPNPTVVLLDEPSAGLDPAGRIQLRQVIASLAAQGKAVIVSSHIIADLEEYCTHIAIIERGRLLRFSHVDELSPSPRGRSTYRLQAAGDDDLTDAIMAIEGVTRVARRGDAYTLEYDAGAERASRLLQLLVERRVPVSSFTVSRTNWEELYLGAGVKQVD